MLLLPISLRPTWSRVRGVRGRTGLAGANVRREIRLFRVGRASCGSMRWWCGRQPNSESAPMPDRPSPKRHRGGRQGRSTPRRQMRARWRRLFARPRPLPRGPVPPPGRPAPALPRGSAAAGNRRRRRAPRRSWDQGQSPPRAISIQPTFRPGYTCKTAPTRAGRGRTHRDCRDACVWPAQSRLGAPTVRWPPRRRP